MKYEYPLIYCEVADHIATITLNAPPFNLLNETMLENFEDILNSLEQETDLRAVILTGAGTKAFSAGDDIGEIAEPTPQQMEALDTKNRMLFYRIHTFPCPVIAAISGYALGGGMELTSACDIRVAAENAKFGLTETKLGLMPTFGATQYMARTIGLGEAKKMIYTGEMITAQRAYEINYVQDVFPVDELQDKAMELARVIASRGPLGVQLSKKALNIAVDTNIHEGFNAERIGSRTTFASEDGVEGMAAFKEKRAPEFKNR